jgi:hypothetical protein
LQTLFPYTTLVRSVAYSLAFAPMGNRFDMPIEVLVFGLLFWVFAVIARTFVFRSQQQR